MAFFAQKTLFLGQFLIDFFLTERGGTPPPPSRTAGSKKPNGKKLTERGGPPPPPSRTISVTGVFETSPYHLSFAQLYNV